MPQITISIPECKRLVAFCKCNGLTQYFIAKDHGAYLGASKGPKPEQRVLFFFKGCDPSKDADYYENARYGFGGDDFGEQLELSELEALLDRTGKWEADMQAQGKRYKPIRSVCWKVTETSISFKAQ